MYVTKIDPFNFSLRFSPWPQISRFIFSPGYLCVRTNPKLYKLLPPHPHAQAVNYETASENLA